MLRNLSRSFGIATAVIVGASLVSAPTAGAEDAYNPYGTPGGKYGSTHPLFTTGPPNVFYHNVGLLELFVSNIGRVGNGQLNLDSVSAGWRGGEYLYIGAMWIGAIAPDNLAYVSTGGYDFELLPSLDPVDTIYPAYEGIANGNRPGFSPAPDDDNDGVMDEEFLNGKDDDGDGLIDEDYAAVSQQMFSCEYWDYSDLSSDLNAEHRPLNVRVQQKSYAWSTTGSNEFIGFDFDIINDGFEVLRQVYLGFFVDSDAGPKDADGYWTDDGVALFSTDTTFVDPSISYECNDRVSQELFNCAEQVLNLDIMYMYDVPDDGNTAEGGDVDGYFGGMFLGHTTDPFGERAPEQVEMHTARFFSGNNPYPAGDPRNDTERYDLLQSGERSTRPSTQPNDYRYTFAAGPFAELLPGEKIQLQVAFVAGQGRDGMITNAINAQRIYNGRWRDIDSNPLTGVDGRETCLRALSAAEPQFWRDECDSLNPSQRTIKVTQCLIENYVDNDCNCCTPLLPSATETGLETLVNWVGTVAPPPPNTNVDIETGIYTHPCDPDRPSVLDAIVGVQVYAPPGDRRVELQWDNVSELTADPIQARILFAGYRIWRVEGWDRPVGSVGPAPNDWQLVADLSYNPLDGDSSASPFYLPKYSDADFDSTLCQDLGDCCLVNTGSVREGEEVRQYRPPGYYSYTDTLGLKNGMVYFYDVTAYSAWTDTSGLYFELESLPSATEAQAVTPRWDAVKDGSLDEVFVVPNPYIANENPAGWDLTPSDSDPTGTKIMFAGLPDEPAKIKILTLAGDLVETLDHDGNSGSVEWKLISRNGQDVVSGVYIYSVETSNDNKLGRFVIVR